MSGGPGFLVDLDALGSAASGITGVLADLGAQLVDDFACDPVSLGHDRLAYVVGDFCDCWRQGIESLVQDSQQIADGLVQTVDTYRHADVGARDALEVAVSGNGAGDAAL